MTTFLFAMFQGGGNIPLILPVAASLCARGHQVRVLAGPGVWSGRMPVGNRFREQIALSVPDLYRCRSRSAIRWMNHPGRGLVWGWTPAPLVRCTIYTLPYRWSVVWATNVVTELKRAPADVVVADHLLVGALVGAEAAGIPSAALVSVRSLGPGNCQVRICGRRAQSSASRVRRSFDQQQSMLERCPGAGMRYFCPLAHCQARWVLGPGERCRQPVLDLGRGNNPRRIKVELRVGG